MAKLVLATSQFRIEKQIDKNLNSVLRHMRYASHKGAHLIHFSEACLSGYLGVELTSTRQTDWAKLRSAVEQVLELAKVLSLWVVLGCNHRLTGKNKPHNSLYVIDGRGRLVDRYDKRFCTGSSTRNGDLKHYSPGNKFITFKVRNMTCGLLICHDFRYPELFREYKKLGVQLMLVSFHNARMKREQFDHYLNSVPATLKAAAGSNYYAISSNNGTRPYAWPSFVLDQEGEIINKAVTHRDSVLITTIDTNRKLYDASLSWRDRCIRGIYNSGKLVADPRSKNRKCL